MTRYTVELADAAQIEGVGTTAFSAPVAPAFGDEMIILDAGRFRVLRFDHHCVKDGDTFLVRAVAVVEPAT